MSVNNSVRLIGNVGYIDNLKEFEGGGKTIRISIATNDVYKNKKGEKVERTEWHNVTFSNRLAEVIAEHLVKGATLAVEGELRSRKYIDEKGIDRHFTEVMGSGFKFLDKK